MNLKSIFILLVLLFSFSSLLFSQENYFLCAYMDGKAQDLRYCVSKDGYRFTSVNNGKALLKSNFGGKIIRDPFILRDKQERYHLIATNAWNGRDFAIWDSKDLVHWKHERLIKASPIDADKTWAPEAIYNEKGDNYIFYWTSSLGDEPSRWAIYYASTKDFKHFSEAAVLMESDEIILDAHIAKCKNKFFLFYRYREAIWRMESEQLVGEVYKNPQKMIDANGEGPFVYQVSPGRWNIVWDYFKNGGYFGMAESTDLTRWNWLTAKSFPYNNEKVLFPVGVRHGCVIPISKQQMDYILNSRF